MLRKLLRVFSSTGSLRSRTFFTFPSKSLMISRRFFSFTSWTVVPERSAAPSPSDSIATWKKMLMRFLR